MTLSPADQELLDALDPADGPANGVPDPVHGAAADRLCDLAREVTGGRVRVSPLGAAWSGDVDVHVERIDPAALAAHGWVRLASLLRRIGSSGDRWAVVEGSTIHGAIDLHEGDVPDPVAAIEDRCRRRGEVRLREVLELRVLQRAGTRLTASDVVGAAAAAEAALGGRDLEAFRAAEALLPPVRLGGGIDHRLRRSAGRARRALRPKVVLGFSGVDGSGKSTLTRAIAATLQSCGVPSSIVWSRPGMRLGPLDRVAKVLRRASGGGDEPGVRAVAVGRTDVASRRGLVGAVWSLLVTIAFVIDVRRQHARARGVVIYDRHLIDALVTLDFVYGGASLRIPRLLVTRLLPRAHHRFYVEVSEDVAVARKPDDTFGRHAVRTQLEAYAAKLAEANDVVVLDGTAPLDALVLDVVRRIAS